LSLLTVNQEIGGDSAALFGNLLLGNLEGNYSHLWVAPNSFKSNILECIDGERQRAARGEDAAIIIKCNALTDKEIIEGLAAASQDGVKISLIVRGICCLAPQIPGLTENIRVLSIVGKFLEHSRVFCFGTGQEKKIYISSADLMTRNTQRRVEVACPIYDPALRDRLYRMLETMLLDNTQAWEQYAGGDYSARYRPGTSLIINSQELFTEEARAGTLRAEREQGRRGKGAALSWVLAGLKGLFARAGG
jgi:polyphosphate kinase